MGRHTPSMRWALSMVGLVLAAAMTGAQQKPSAMLAVAIRPDKAPPSIMFVDPASGKLMGRVPAGPDPHGLMASEDGKLLFVANVNSHDTGAVDGDSLSVIDVAAMKEIHRVHTGENTHPHDVRVAGGKLYFTAQGWQSVGLYNPARNKIEWMLGLGQHGPHHVAVTKDGRSIFATNGGSNSISTATLGTPDTLNHGKSVIPQAPSWTVTTLPGGEDAEGVDVSPDGREAWTSDKEKSGGRVTIIDGATKKVKQVVPMQTKHANRLRFSVDGRHVLLLDRETNEMLIIDAASRKIAKRLKFPGDKPGEFLSVYDFAAGPDGRAYVSVSAGAIATRYDAEGNNIRASAGDRSVVGNRAWLAVIDLETLAIVNRLPVDAGADTVAWVGPM